MYYYILLCIFIILNLFIKTTSVDVTLNLFVDDYLDGIYIDGVKVYSGRDDIKYYTYTISIEFGNYIEICFSDFESAAGIALKFSFYNNGVLETYKTDYGTIFQGYHNETSTEYPYGRTMKLMPYDFTLYYNWTVDEYDAILLGEVNSVHPLYNYEPRYKSYMYKFYIPNTIACGYKNIIIDDNNKAKKIDMNKLLFLGNNDVYTNKKQFKIISTSFVSEFGANVNYLLLSNGTSIKIGTIYDSDVLLYSSLGYGVLDIINYVGIYKNESNSIPEINTVQCQIYATTCYETCSRCYQVTPTKENQQCISCKSGYVLDYNNNCNVNCTEKDTYSYMKCETYTCIDETVDRNIVDADFYCIRECSDENCRKCEYTDYYDEICLYCMDGFTLKEEGDCYEGTSLDGYYLDTSDVPNILRKCYETCEKCSSEGNYENPNCISTECVDDAYYLHEDDTKCYFSPLENYRLINDVWYNITLCPYNCLTCEDILIEGLMNCMTCSDDYYKLEDNLTECYESTTEIDGYYFDVDIFKRCFESCETCNSVSDINNHNCKICKNGYKNLEDNLTQCYENPPDGYYNSDLNEDSFLLCYENCGTCIKGFMDDSMNCLSCKSGYKYLIDNSTECFNIPPDGYADSGNNLYYEKCHSSCKTCSDIPNHLMNCIDCKDNYAKLFDNLTECYLITSEVNNYYYDSDEDLFFSCEGKNNYYINSLGIKICVDTCPDEYEFLISEQNKCVSDCVSNGYLIENLNCVTTCSLNYIQNENNCIFHTPEPEPEPEPEENENTEKTEEIKEKEENKIIDIKKEYISNSLINDISDIILSYDLNTVYEGEDFSMTITKTSNKSSSVIIDDECIKILKDIYKIGDDEDLLLLTLDIDDKNNENLINGIRYKVFSPSGEELDLSYCKNTQTIVKYTLNASNINFNLTLAAELLENGYNIFDSNSSFFNDICSPFKDENDNDVILSERRDLLFCNVSLCEDGCTLKEINYTSLEVFCNCDIQEEFNVENVNETTSNNLENDFKEMLPKTNLYLIKCYKTFYHFKNLKYNIGFWFFLICILLELFLFFYYIIDGMRYIEAKINEFIRKKDKKSNKKFKNALYNLKKIAIKNPPKKHIKFSDNEEKRTDINKLKNDDKNLKMQKKVTIINKINPNSVYSFKSGGSLIHKKLNSEEMILDNNDNLDENEDNKKVLISFLIKKDDLVTCPYSVAIKEDKRTFFPIFCDNFKDNQGFLKSVIRQSVYELICVKISGYIFSICLDFFLNAVFYTDEVVNEKYKNNSLSFMTEFLKSFYSCAVGFLICKISLNFSEIFFIYEILETEYNYSKYFLFVIRRSLKITNRKLIIFFCSIMLFTLFFLYYCTIFCYVYNGSQMNWFKGGWSSFLISLITTFVLCLIISILRYFSLKQNSKYVYNTSIFLNSYV